MDIDLDLATTPEPDESMIAEALQIADVAPVNFEQVKEDDEMSKKKKKDKKKKKNKKKKKMDIDLDLATTPEPDESMIAEALQIADVAPVNFEQVKEDDEMSKKKKKD